MSLFSNFERVYSPGFAVRLRLSYIIIILFLLVFSASYIFFLNRPDLFWEIRDGTVRISDLGYYLTIIRGVITGDGTSFYQPETHLSALSKLVGAPVAKAMPVGVSPTVVLILLPLALLPVDQYALGISLLNALGVTLFVGCWVPLLIRYYSKPSLAFRTAAALVVILLSMSSQTNFILGQFAMIAVGLICASFMLSRKDSSTSNTLMLVVCGTFLSIKLHYLAIFIVVLVCSKKYKELLFVLVSVVVSTAFSLNILGWESFGPFLKSLGVFSVAEKPDFLSGGFPADRMIVFKAAFSGWLDARFVTLLSWSGGAVMILFAGYFWVKDYSNQLLTVPILLVTAAYLLFTPHMGSEYEDLLLAIPIFICVREYRSYQYLNSAILLAFVVLNADFFRPCLASCLLWLVKLTSLGLLLLSAFRGKDCDDV